MPITIRLHTESSIPLEVDSLQLSTIRELSVEQISKTLLFRGNEELPCGDFFDVSGSAADDNTVVWQGNLQKVKLIGCHLTDGTVRVEGHVGMHLGAEMRGGEIIVNGNAADWVGAEMKGGRIRIHGNAGHGGCGAEFRQPLRPIRIDRVFDHGRLRGIVGIVGSQLARQ